MFLAPPFFIIWSLRSFNHHFIVPSDILKFVSMIPWSWPFCIFGSLLKNLHDALIFPLSKYQYLLNLLHFLCPFNLTITTLSYGHVPPLLPLQSHDCVFVITSYTLILNSSIKYFRWHDTRGVIRLETSFWTLVMLWTYNIS